MMERCNIISPFVLFMYEDVKRCSKMCGNICLCVSLTCSRSKNFLVCCR